MSRPSIAAEYKQLFGHPAAVVARAPGRVNLIGEHTDYNEGFVLPFAIDRAVEAAVGVGAAGVVRVRSMATGETVEFPADVTTRAERSVWQNYIRGVVAGLRQAGARLDSADVLIGGDLPSGSGLSSSAALCVATALALGGLAGKEIAPLDLARLAQRAEHDFAGTPCGIMDQYVSLAGQAGQALLIDCRSLTHEYVPLELRDHELWVVHSGVKHELSGGAYEQRVRECRTAVAALQEAERGIRSLRDVTADLLQRHLSRLDAVVAKRARHVVSENRRVHQMVTALRAGRVAEAGQILLAGHRSLRDDYEVSCAEIDELIRLLTGISGVAGARMVGGGFGGAILVIVQAESADDVPAKIAAHYNTTHARPAQAVSVRPAAGAKCWRV